MPEETSRKRTGLYEKTVQKLTEFLKPHLHNVTQDFVDKSVDTYAKDNPKFARIIEFEVRRRGDGPGLTQDVAEPLLWASIKTISAVAIAAFTHRLKNKQFKLMGDVTVIGLVLNNIVDLFRLVPRYKAGLQGSLEMAKDRWQSIEETGIDPFSSQTREINSSPLVHKYAAHTHLKDNSWQQRVSDIDIASGKDRSPVERS